ncbi:septum formation inhibitor Maf [Devosia geojensis]|uniref:Nucleoside triphosphate pyrophosphatase n=1 Tax=Devosia geojensis TaxID=443610 RepID=A0A0F5FIP9_9HYPH|nr:Maf family protein [Devosia geojensis]KKB08455.1 septum formation inhibitor Maf [Devosia geojensis]
MLILASQSAARRALLAGAGLDFAVEPAAVDERAIEAQAEAAGGDARDIALLLAAAKARAVAAARDGALVIGADQTLSLGPRIFHKPDSMAAAAEQLDTLRGKTHRLHAAIALARGEAVLWSQVETAELTMREFSLEERDEVLALEGEAVLGSVGGYRLEGPSIRLFATVTGDYFTILGLPLLPLLAALREFAPELLAKAPA